MVRAGLHRWYGPHANSRACRRHHPDRRARALARAARRGDDRAQSMADENRPVIVAFDGSPESGEAVRAAAELFRDRLLVVVSIWEPALAISESMMPVAGIGGATYTPPSVEQMQDIDQARGDHAQTAAEAGAQLASAAGARV